MIALIALGGAALLCLGQTLTEKIKVIISGVQVRKMQRTNL
jgi:hypothetical protein